MSDELELQASSWAEKYHLAKARHFLLRPFQLKGDEAILEIGAGCGPITRYLGERGGLVDAVEPVAARARAARLRTKDLSNVEVFIGTAEDVPNKPAYDLITLIGVLEYVAEGSCDLEHYVTFLRRLRGLLRPDGILLIAIENRIGVKYLAGAAEDHSWRPFDGIDGYARDVRARTFTRTELQQLLHAADLNPLFLHVFPDYKMPRAVLGDRLFMSEPSLRSLAWRVPLFPSDDHGAPRQKGPDERSLWRTMVEEGVAKHFSNSFLVVTGTGEGRLRPEDHVLAFYSSARRGIFTTETRVVPTAKGTRLIRRCLGEEGEPEVTAGLRHRPEDSYLVEGLDLVEAMAKASRPRFEKLLRGWLSAIESRVTDEAVDQEKGLDLIPRNFILAHDGSLQPIDQEWMATGWSIQDVVARGVLWLAIDLAARTPPERWKANTTRGLALELAAMAEVQLDDRWVDAAIEREAKLQTEVVKVSPHSPAWGAELGGMRARLEALLSEPLSSGPLGQREYERRADLETSLREATARRDALEARRTMRLYRRFQMVRSKLFASARRDRD